MSKRRRRAGAPTRRSLAAFAHKDEAQRIAANIAKLLSYCGKPKCDP